MFNFINSDSVVIIGLEEKISEDYCLDWGSVSIINKLQRLYLVQACLIIGAFCLLTASSFGSSQFSSILFHINSMKLDEGIVIKQITDHPSFIEIKGQSPDKISAYKLAEKFLHSMDLRPYKFADSVPFWNKSEMTIILNKSDAPKKSAYVFFNEPDTRSVIKEDFSMNGLCSREGGEIILSGDIQGKTKCKNGRWKFETKLKNVFEGPIIGVQISQRGMNSEISKDFRSFQTN